MVAQRGIGGEGGAYVPRHLDLRHDGDAAGGRVPHQTGEFGPRVRPAVRDAVVRAAAGRAGLGLGAMAADLGELGTGGDRHAPALVVGEMHMEHVDLVQGQHVDVPAQIGDGLEVACHVQHRAAPGVPGVVGDLGARQQPRSVGLRSLRQGLWGQELTDRLDTAQQTGEVRGAQQCGVRGDREDVSLVAQAAAEAGVDGQLQLPARGRWQGQSGGGGEQGAQQFRGRFGACADVQGGVVVQREVSRPQHGLGGAGDEGDCGRVCGHGSPPERSSRGLRGVCWGSARVSP